jgi:hypothetical protein
MRSLTHLIEIDLLWQGKRVPMQQPLPPAPYYVLVGRAEKCPILQVWPIQFFGYDLSIDYSQPPSVPLTGAAAEWAAARVREANIVKQT